MMKYGGRTNMGSFWVKKRSYVIELRASDWLSFRGFVELPNPKV